MTQRAPKNKEQRQNHKAVSSTVPLSAFQARSALTDPFANATNRNGELTSAPNSLSIRKNATSFVPPHEKRRLDHNQRRSILQPAAQHSSSPEAVTSLVTPPAERQPKGDRTEVLTSSNNHDDKDSSPCFLPQTERQGQTESAEEDFDSEYGTEIEDAKCVRFSYKR